MLTIEECEDNVRTCRRAGNVEGEAIWLGAVAARHRDSHNGSKALETYGQALRLWERLENQRNIGSTYHSIALVYEDVLHDLPRAIEYCRRAIALTTGENKTSYEWDLQLMLKKQAGIS